MTDGNGIQPNTAADYKPRNFGAWRVNVEGIGMTAATWTDGLLGAV